MRKKNKLKVAYMHLFYTNICKCDLNNIFMLP